MMKRLALHMITRGRPHLLPETLESILNNITDKNTVLMVSADDDDPETIRALERYQETNRILGRFDGRLLVSVRPREDSNGGKWNRVMAIEADIYGPVSDYGIFSTRGFDARILEAGASFPDGIGCVYGPLCNLSFPVFQGMTRKLVQKLGFIYPEHFPYWFVDHWIDDIARIIDRIAYADIQVDGISRKQPTLEMRELKFWAGVFNAGYLVRRSQAHAIINDRRFIEPPWRKALLKRHHPLIEQRSRMLNVGMAEGAGREPQQGGGDRYSRLKDKALRLMSGWAAELDRDLPA